MEGTSASRFVIMEKGISPAVLEAGRRSGHYGLPGMYERTKLIGGKLELHSQPDSGTEIDLSISASMAYPRSDTLPRSTPSGQGG